MTDVSQDSVQDSINVVLLDADEQFRTLMAHHITTAWPGAEIESLACLGDMDESAKPHCFVLDHMTLQQAASEDAQIWFRAAAAIASSPCIVIADPSDELLAVRYIKGGAKDFLPKRLIKHDLIISSINECLEFAAAADSTGSEPDGDALAEERLERAKKARSAPGKNGKSRARQKHKPKVNGSNESVSVRESKPEIEQKTASAEQIARFKERVGPSTNRPTQPHNARMILD